MSGLASGDYWPYIWASYALAGVALSALAVTAYLRLRHWAAKARAITEHSDTDQ